MQNKKITSYFDDIPFYEENQISDHYCSEVTNYPKFLRESKLYGSSDITCMEERMIETIPENLQDFFQANPEV